MRHSVLSNDEVLAGSTLHSGYILNRCGNCRPPIMTTPVRPQVASESVIIAPQDTDNAGDASASAKQAQAKREEAATAEAIAHIPKAKDGLGDKPLENMTAEDLLALKANLDQHSRNVGIETALLTQKDRVLKSIIDAMGH
ncbi:hypothetical protein MW7_016865 [Imbroritus primus]|uniref:Uncharacterized protein n=1 Tax=Imbroritus primus TaxID=3058603 RepID=A0ACD3SKK2_9BURK|nr:hypothetical protein MW7_016865 [Burkholderiaceae bacterium PBA]